MIEKIHYEMGQTALTVVADTAYLPCIKDAVCRARSVIESKIFDDPFFGMTFDPYPVSGNDDPLIQRMCQASERSGVGPMAGVAGAVADYAVRAAVEEGCRHVIVENGGDISMFISEPVKIGVFASEEKFGNMALNILPAGKVTGICSSSGKIGPSVSFGRSGICTVFSDDTVLADCCATALGNMIVKGTAEEMSESCEKICSVGGVTGCICVCNGLVSMCGDIPEMSEGVYSDGQLTGILY